MNNGYRARAVKAPGKIGSCIQDRRRRAKYSNTETQAAATKRRCPLAPASQRVKVFCFFFSKKKDFFFEKKKQKTFALLEACAPP